MSILRGVKSAYSLFGTYGLLLVAKTRLLRQAMEVKVSVSGLTFPVHVRLRTTDVSLLSEMMEDAEYDIDLPTPPRVIVDAGANIGLTTVFFANKYPQARIIAVEPELSNFNLLKKNAEPYPNITCLRAALWKNNTKIELSDPGLGHWGFQATEKPVAGGPTASPTEVPGITVDALMKQFGINYLDFLRMDIEGAEQEVCEHTSSWMDKVGVIGVELHDRLKPGCSRSFYLATKDFDWEFRKGETVFLGRGARQAGKSSAPSALDSLPSGRSQAREKRVSSIVSAT
jgi:FkbM family methyltransferase